LLGEVQISYLRGQVVDVSQEGLQGRCDVDTRFKGGAEQGEEYLFPDREGGDVRRSDGGETRGREPKVSGSLVEERDQMVEISSGREGRERGCCTDSRGAALMGGHVWR